MRATPKLFKDFINFLSNLKIDVRKSELVCSFLPVGFLIYTILPEQILFFHYAVYIYFIVLGSFFALKGMLFVIKHPRWQKWENISIAELEDLAKKLHLNLPATNPFYVVNKQDYLAGVVKNRKILFGKYYLNNLDSAERIFVGGHEFFHISGKEEKYMFMPLIPIISSGSILLILLNIDYVIVSSICFGLLLLSMSLTKRSIESMADLHGVTYSGKKAAINALTKGYAMKKHTLFDFHPRLQIRVKNIEKHIPNSKSPNN